LRQKLITKNYMENRLSLYVNPKMKIALENCRKKLKMENKSMIVRRALINFFRDNMPELDIDELMDF